MIRTLVFIPSFNDHEHLDEMIEYVSNLGSNHMILVIDDGSDVPIKINSKSSRVYIVRVPFNAGLGLALNIALDFAKFKQVDVLVRIDSDGQHPLKDIVPLVASLEKQSKDLSLGCRINADTTSDLINVLKTVSKKYMNFVVWFLVGIRVRDPHTGLFALNRNGIVKLSKSHFNRYPEIQLLLEAKAVGLTIGSIEVYSKDRLYNKSSIKFWDAIFIFLRFHVSILDYFLKKFI